MENKLSEEELKTVIDFVFDIENYGLNVARDYFGEQAEQARNQIKKMIENYDEVQAFAMEIIEGKAEKKTITRKRVESFLPERIDYAGSLKDGILEMLKELGVEVVEK